MNKGKTNRTKGHVYERFLAKIFRGLGYQFCKTSRQASRLYDNCGIDLHGIPFLIQAKNGYEKNRIKADLEFDNIDQKLIENFEKDSKEFKLPKLLFNKLNGKKKNNHLVTLTFDDWLKSMMSITALNQYINTCSEEEKEKFFKIYKKIEDEINNITTIE